MSLRFELRILDHLSHQSYKPSKVREIARQMGIAEEDRGEFDQTFGELKEQGRIEIAKDGRVRLPGYGEELVGMFRQNKRGFGFVLPDEPRREGDLFIPPNATGDAISGDKVRARVVHDKRRRGKGDSGGRTSGRIIEVIERGREQFVGALRKAGNYWVVEPDGKLLYEPVVVRDPGAKNAREGDKVVIELLHYPDREYYGEGVITKVLGDAGKPDVETQAVIEAHGLRTEFPEAALDEARQAARHFESQTAARTDGELEREDLTDQFIFTIDPPDARDFDDAISIEYDKKRGEWTLGVHIADVTNFVDHSGALDREAQQRATSVYLPQYVIPMLPELLSNGVCSLQEGVDRFTKSVFITLNDEGRVLDQRAAATIIRSRKRMTYLEAQALIDGDKNEARKHAVTETEHSEELIEKLRLSNNLAQILEQRRIEHGMIVLDLPDVELEFDDEGHVVDAHPEDDAYTHKVIEMFMVEANEAIARLFSGLKIAILRRIHPEPTFGDMQELETYARVVGFRLPDEPTRHDMQKLLDKTRNTPASRAIHFAALRTLTKATYSPAMVGHYALASDHYAHFTSPIRRYPDLSAHRALTAYLELTDNGNNVPGGKKRDRLTRQMRDDARVLDESQLVTLGRHCSDMEVEAEEAERDLRDYLVMQFLREHHLGDEFPGVVSGVTNGGVFVSIEKFLVEGLVPTDDLAGLTGEADKWRVQESTGRLTAKRSGASFGIGDQVTVRIDNVDLGSRHLHLVITKGNLQYAEVGDGKPLPAKQNQSGGKSKGKPKSKGGGKGRGGKSSGKGRR